MRMDHFAKRASAYSLERQQGVMRARVRGREVLRVEVYPQLRATAHAVAEESHELMHGHPVWNGASALHIQGLEARLRRDGR